MAEANERATVASLELIPQSSGNGMENPRTYGLNIDETRFQFDYLVVIALGAWANRRPRQK